MLHHAIFIAIIYHTRNKKTGWSLQQKWHMGVLEKWCFWHKYIRRIVSPQDFHAVDQLTSAGVKKPRFNNTIVLKKIVSYGQNLIASIWDEECWWVFQQDRGCGPFGKPCRNCCAIIFLKVHAIVYTQLYARWQSSYNCMKLVQLHETTIHLHKIVKQLS